MTRQNYKTFSRALNAHSDVYRAFVRVDLSIVRIDCKKAKLAKKALETAALMVPNVSIRVEIKDKQYIDSINREKHWEF